MSAKDRHVRRTKPNEKVDHSRHDNDHCRRLFCSGDASRSVDMGYLAALLRDGGGDGKQSCNSWPRSDQCGLLKSSFVVQKQIRRS